MYLEFGDGQPGKIAGCVQFTRENDVEAVDSPEKSLSEMVERNEAPSVNSLFCNPSWLSNVLKVFFSGFEPDQPVVGG